MSTLCAARGEYDAAMTLARLGKNTGDRRLSKRAGCLSGSVSPRAAQRRVQGGRQKQKN